MRYVYLVRAGKLEYKVGVTANIGKRIKQLQTSNGKQIELITAKQTPNAEVVERSIHKLLAEHRLNGGREWFKLKSNQVINICVLINKSPGIIFNDIEQLQMMIQQQADTQKEMVAHMESLLEQAKFELKPKQFKSVIQEQVVRQTINKEDRDELDMQAALEVFKAEGKASTSLMQRRLSLGYGKAARIMDKLEAKGYISSQDGATARQVLVG